MTIQLTCPYCRFSKELPESVIPSNAKRAVCPQCGQQFLFSRTEAPPAPPEPPPAQPAEVPLQTTPVQEDMPTAKHVPWENRETIGFWQGFFQTVKALIVSPAAFFRADRHPPGFREPFGFGFLTGTLGSMAAFFWQALLALAGVSSFGGLLAGHLSILIVFVVLLLVIPFTVATGLFVYGAFLHLFLRLTGAGREGFESTFRVVAYSQAIQLMAFIPLVGSWVAGLWQLVVQVIGLRTIHATSYGRVILAFLVPLAACILLGISILLLIPFFLLRAS